MIEKRIAKSEETHMLIFDLEKAYDNVLVKMLFEVLKKTINKAYVGSIRSKLV